MGYIGQTCWHVPGWPLRVPLVSLRHNCGQRQGFLELIFCQARAAALEFWVAIRIVNLTLSERSLEWVMALADACMMRMHACMHLAGLPQAVQHHVGVITSLSSSHMHAMHYSFTATGVPTCLSQKLCRRFVSYQGLGALQNHACEMAQIASHPTHCALH